MALLGRGPILLSLKIFRKPTEALQGLSPLLGETTEDPSSLPMRSAEILLQQLDRYRVLMIVSELGLKPLPVREFRKHLKTSSELQG
jgi:hypothetical protein